MHAIDVMSRPVFTVRSDDPVEQATALLTTHNIASAPVVDSAGDLVGMVSEGDLLTGRVPGYGAAVQSEVQHRLDDYAAGQRRWSASVANGVVSISGHFADDVEETIVGALARTVPGVAAVRFGAPR